MNRQLCLLATLAMALASPTAHAEESSWIFRQGRYSHDRRTGDRVIQYAPAPPIAALPDSRPYSSGYRRSRTVQRGADGTVTEYTHVDNWGNDRGGLDAQWERFNRVWQNSELQGGFGTNRFFPHRRFGTFVDPRFGPGLPADRFPGYGPGYGYPR